MKKLFLFLLLAICSAKAEYIDLTKGNVLGIGVCKYFDGKIGKCVKVAFQGDEYIVVVDEKGEKVIFKINGDNIQFIWARDMI